MALIGLTVHVKVLCTVRTVYCKWTLNNNCKNDSLHDIGVSVIFYDPFYLLLTLQINSSVSNQPLRPSTNDPVSCGGVAALTLGGVLQADK